MSNAARLSDSSDDDASNVLTSADDDNRWGSAYPPTSDSDSEDLEVVEPVGTPQSQSSTNERINYQDESPYQMSHFYNQSYDSDKNEQEPSYSLDEPATGIEFSDYESNYEQTVNKKHSKKKKEKSASRNNESSKETVPSNKKNSKRKHEDFNFTAKQNKRFRSSDSSIENNKIFTRSKKRSYESQTSGESSASDAEDNQQTLGFKSDYNTLKSSALPDISDEAEELSFGNYGKKKEEQKSSKRNEKYSSVETTALSTRIASSNKGNLLMKKMGYKEGEGLGKNAQGRVDPVELSKQKGRRGLGHSLPGLDNEKIEWDPSLEEISVSEPIVWLENEELDPLDYEIMLESWLTEGPKNLDIESMTDFVDEEVLSSILKKKTVFDNLTEDELRRTVLRSNPFESLRKGIFMNRAALKMANMDSAFDFMFTNPKDREGRPMVRENGLLYFADVCAGPGGFSEYVLWKKKWRAKGIGFTLKGDCDFKIQDFIAGPSETFEPYYGVKDDGNIYDPENITSLTEFVLDVTERKGVHFMMADGGFSVKGQENIQEILSKQLYLCQFLVAISIVRTEGHFVCKLFDLFSPFSAGLVYLLYRAFDQICIFKPNTSRPANSERYIVCKHRKADVDAIRDYLFQINLRMWKLGEHSSVDIIECVPVSILKDNAQFFTYLRDSNNTLGNKQIVNLDKIAAFYQDPNLHEGNQNDLRKQCMERWKVPLQPRRADQSSDMEVTRNIMKSVLNDKFKPESISEILNLRGKKLTPRNLKGIFDFSILDWECIPLGSEKIVFLLGLGKNRVYQWGGTRWEPEDKLNIELPAGTLLYGEFVFEYRGEGMKQKKITAFHVIDGLSIGYEIISKYHFDQRMNLLTLFTTALKKWHNNSLCPVRVKTPTEMKDIHYIYRRLTSHFMKSGSYETCLDCHEDNYLLQMKGICFIPTTKEPWHKHFSKNTNWYYYFNSTNGKSLFENHRPQEAVATAVDSLKNQILWIWEAGVGFSKNL